MPVEKALGYLPIIVPVSLVIAILIERLFKLLFPKAWRRCNNREEIDP